MSDAAGFLADERAWARANDRLARPLPIIPCVVGDGSGNVYPDPSWDFVLVRPHHASARTVLAQTRRRDLVEGDIVRCQFQADRGQALMKVLGRPRVVSTTAIYFITTAAHYIMLGEDGTFEDLGPSTGYPGSRPHVLVSDGCLYASQGNGDATFVTYPVVTFTRSGGWAPLPEVAATQIATAAGFNPIFLCMIDGAPHLVLQISDRTEIQVWRLNGAVDAPTLATTLATDDSYYLNSVSATGNTLPGLFVTMIPFDFGGPVDSTVHYWDGSAWTEPGTPIVPSTSTLFLVPDTTAGRTLVGAIGPPLVAWGIFEWTTTGGWNLLAEGTPAGANEAPSVSRVVAGGIYYYMSDYLSIFPVSPAAKFSYGPGSMTNAGRWARANVDGIDTPSAITQLVDVVGSRNIYSAVAIGPNVYFATTFSNPTTWGTYNWPLGVHRWNAATEDFTTIFPVNYPTDALIIPTLSVSEALP